MKDLGSVSSSMFEAFKKAAKRVSDAAEKLHKTSESEGPDR